MLHLLKYFLVKHGSYLNLTLCCTNMTVKYIATIIRHAVWGITALLSIYLHTITRIAVNIVSKLNIDILIHLTLTPCNAATFLIRPVLESPKGVRIKGS